MYSPATSAVLSLVLLSACSAPEVPVEEPSTPTPAIEAKVTTAEPPRFELSEVVATTNGGVRGLVEDGVSVFKGIPYAAPPTGKRRFLPPQPAESWDVTFDAFDFGAPAMQMYTSSGGDTELAWQLAEIFPMRSEMKVDNEDCLYLNVWTPNADSTSRPVMVWLHGGGFAYGSGSWPLYDGANLAREGDVVVVSVNHRLNVFGYLSLVDVAGEGYAASGNAGMLDLVQSLQWVRDNIAAFGGDPGNVTIMGESGGGSKVSTLMAMPTADGLFHKAIIQSGPGLTAVAQKDATANARAILAELSTAEDQDPIAALMTATADEILAATASAAAKAGGGPFGNFQLAPVMDGSSLPRHPFTPDAPAQSSDIPLLIGWNKDEMSLFNFAAPWFGTLTNESLAEQAGGMLGEHAAAFLDAYETAHPDYSPTYILNAIIGDRFMFAGSATLAERQVDQGPPVYMYYLTWETPVAGGLFKSPHTIDIPFMFKNVDKAAVLTSHEPDAFEIERQMSNAWIAFARTGDPNSADLPTWPQYDSTARATMVFDVPPRVENDPKKAIRELIGALNQGPAGG